MSVGLRVCSRARACMRMCVNMWSEHSMCGVCVCGMCGCVMSVHTEPVCTVCVLGRVVAHAGGMACVWVHAVSVCVDACVLCVSVHVVHVGVCAWVGNRWTDGSFSG